MNSLFQAVGDCRAQTSPETIPGAFEAVFVFPQEFLGFAGHFPDNPILPGIAQIMTVLHACGGGLPPSLRGIKTCKFLRPVLPGEPVVVRGEKKTDAGKVTVTATLSVKDVPCASMTLFVDGQDAGVF